MEINRKKEQQYLNTFYEKEKSQLIITYGQKHIGKTSLVNEFVKDKASLYYLAREVSAKEQYRQMANELREQGLSLPAFPEKEQLFLALIHKAWSEKLVIVIDEFEHLLKSDSGFMDSILKLMQEAQVLIIFVSSSVSFVENNMVLKMGQAAFSISGFLKLKELTFLETKSFMQISSLEQSLEIYSILGGVPGLLSSFQSTAETKDNICKYLLQKDSFLQQEGFFLLSRDLREPAVYASILAALASGNTKLNDIYKYTGFSRAKISVYLKNLMELEFVEKVFSYDTEGRDQAMKGLYRISNHYMKFWFYFIYPHLSSLSLKTPEQFYADYIEPGLKEFSRGYFSQFCRQYMDVLQERGSLDITYERSGVWVGKEGTIDFIASDQSGNTIAAFCCKDNEIMNDAHYQTYMKCLVKARIKPIRCYLFSIGGFDESLLREEKLQNNLCLINMKKELMRD